MVYCFDLDGTLCSITEPSSYQKAEPNWDRIGKVNSLYDKGNIIIIDTARGSETGIDWYEITQNQLSSWGVKYHRLRVGRKIAADFYIDDKGIKDSDFF